MTSCVSALMVSGFYCLIKKSRHLAKHLSFVSVDFKWFNHTRMAGEYLISRAVSREVVISICKQLHTIRVVWGIEENLILGSQTSKTSFHMFLTQRQAPAELSSCLWLIVYRQNQESRELSFLKFNLYLKIDGRNISVF